MKTYAERQQAILFAAAAETYDIASSVLNDCSLREEFLGATYEWAKTTARGYAEKAQALATWAAHLNRLEHGDDAGNVVRLLRP